MLELLVLTIFLASLWSPFKDEELRLGQVAEWDLNPSLPKVIILSGGPNLLFMEMERFNRPDHLSNTYIYFATLKVIM